MCAGKKTKVRPAVTMDLRGTPFTGQLEFLEKLSSLAKQGDAIEVLTCDENTLHEDSGWLRNIRYTLHRVHREHGYYRMIIKPVVLPA
ncbi:MAG: hypothetical protein U0T82_15900 [Bacteroidales bacterium]